MIEIGSKLANIAVSSAGAVVSAVAEYETTSSGTESNYKGRVENSKTVIRDRSEVEKEIKNLEPRQFLRLYRMEKSIFFILLDIIKPHLPLNKKRKRGATPNGPIPSILRLSMAIRYFAGGDPLDIKWRHGVAHSEVLKCVWDVVDAIHASPQLNIKFPETHNEQLKIAQGFKRKSAANLESCAGAIDGMLIWIHKPSKQDMEEQGFGEMKYFCGRKKKFGLNMQAVCDSDKKFLDVEISFPGATSDYFAFYHSKIKQDLEKENFLYPGLCLFGDNAYVNTPYMATPFKAVSCGPKDDYNFYHSQVRINIECAFGILVHRWGILRKHIPYRISVLKTSSLVLALCKLHNFCIFHKQEIPKTTCKDVANIMTNGGFMLPMVDGDGNAEWSDEAASDHIDLLKHGGDHQDDHTRALRRPFRRHEDLPYKKILECIQEGYERPSPKAN